MDKTISWFAFIGIALGLEILVIGMMTGVPPSTLEDITQSFNHIFLGFAGVFGAAGGLTILANYMEKQNLKRRIEALKAKYPRIEFGKGIRMVQAERKHGKMYIYDIRGKQPTLRHISNMQTVRDLEFDEMERETLSDEKFDKARLDISEYIKTRGDLEI